MKENSIYRLIETAWMVENKIEYKYQVFYEDKKFIIYRDEFRISCGDFIKKMREFSDDSIFKKIILVGILRQAFVDEI